MNRRRFLQTVGGLSAAALLQTVPAVLRAADPEELKLSQQDLLKIIEDGLGKTDKPKDVVIVGAGMAGLVAGYELLRAGHKPILLEAQARVGGRVRTLREPFSDGLIGEAGAMRLPAAHKLVRTYVANASARGAAKLETFPFTWSTPNAYCFMRNKRHRWKEIAADPDLLGYKLEDRREAGGLDERHKTPGQLWDATVAPLREMLAKEGPGAWDKIVERYDRYSTRGFLEMHHWSGEAITMFGEVENQLARLNNGCVELLREKLSGSFDDLVQIKGGMDLLPRSFQPKLERSIRFGAKMESLEQSADKVTIHYHDVTHGRRKIEADHAIIAVPFTMLRHVEGIETFSNAKQLAIRGLNYNEAGKILLQCRRRFWEDDDNIFGGYSQTDLSIRNIWYPDHGKETGRGVLLVSYTWGRDAASWSHLSPEERIRQAVEGLARIHPQVAKEDLIETGASIMWQNEPFAGGAFCLFNPTQESRLHRPIRQPEGRFHFAGEHTSLNHRWIEGAVESGLRTAFEVHQARA